MSSKEPNLTELRRLWERAPDLNWFMIEDFVASSEARRLYNFYNAAKDAFPRLLEIAEEREKAQVEINRLNELRERDLGIIFRLQNAHQEDCTCFECRKHDEKILEMYSNE